jgi:hypothetical protein
MQCYSTKAVGQLPSEFESALKAICADMELALDCLKIYGGIPLPVAKAILRNMEPAHAAIDMCVRGCDGAREGLVH